MTNEEFKQYIQEYGANEALFYAVTAEQVQMALDAGADINARDKYDATPLIKVMTFASVRPPEVTKCLLEKGADINARDENKRTALIHAVQHGLENIIKMLLEKGADVNIKDCKGMTALDWSAYELDEVLNPYEVSNPARRELCDKWTRIINLLRKYGAVSVSLLRRESEKQKNNPEFRAKLAAAKERLKSKPKTKSVSGVVIADKIADMIRSGKIKGDVTPEKGKKLSAQIKKEIMMGKKDR